MPERAPQRCIHGARRTAAGRRLARPEGEAEPGPKLSAGRVQSAAVKLLVDRERERMRFVTSEWWDLRASFTIDNKSGRSLIKVFV